MNASDSNYKKTIPGRILLKRLLGYTKPFMGWYILALLMMGVLVFCDLLFPYILGLSLRYLGEEVIEINKILRLGVVGVLSLTVSIILTYYQSLLLNKVGLDIVYKIRIDVLEHIQSLSHAEHNKIPTGTLVTRVTSDVNVIFQLYTNIMINLIKNVVTVIGVFIAMALINGKLTLCMLVVVPILGIVAYVFRYYSRKIHRTVRTNVASMNAFLSENISGMKITQVFNQEDKKNEEFRRNNETLKKNLIKEILAFAIFRPSIYVIYITSVIIVFYFGGNIAINFNLGMTSVVLTYDLLYTFYQYISKFFTPIQALADQFNELQSSYAAAEKIFTILDMEPTVKDSEDAIDVEIKGDIEFRDVWFSYIPGEWVLKGVSFHIHVNDTIAFVGATGSGKTTILSLIVRNYDIQKGEILIDGIDIKKIKLSSLRSQIGQMLQDVFLFSGTVLSNIQMNDESISFEEVKKASEYINASKFIEKLPDKYEEVVRERGNNFSLGQRQLISFARTIVHKPKVMILDEATANIDTETEVLIQDSLEKIINQGTIIIVAHRLSTIQHADCIYVFSNGEIIEQGTHQELLKKHGKYYNLYRLQFEKGELKNN
ncbi:MAG: ABC transporter ATP-binding protein [Bacilli bacterium]|nr:ABC transporter ATP-binding protein [Bacilli bacterium]